MKGVANITVFSALLRRHLKNSEIGIVNHPRALFLLLALTRMILVDETVSVHLYETFMPLFIVKLIQFRKK